MAMVAMQARLHCRVAGLHSSLHDGVRACLQLAHFSCEPLGALYRPSLDGIFVQDRGSEERPALD